MAGTAASGTTVQATGINGGRFDFDDGGTYCGGWEEGKAHGHGVCTGPKGQGEYAGSWHFGFEVSGVYTWPSGSFFEGNWQNGKRHGLGVESRGKWLYRGEWTQGFKGRYGVRQSTATLAKYEGTWANGLQDGYGSETYADGGTYQGQWLRGMRHGYGVRTSAAFGIASHSRGGDGRRPSISSLQPGMEESKAVMPNGTKASEEARGGFVLKSRSDEAPVRRRSLVERTGMKNLMQGLRIRKQRSTGDLDRKGVIGSIRSTGSTTSWMSSESNYAGGASVMSEGSQASFIVEDELLDANITETYMGEWKNDKRCGFGISERSDGLKYEGEWFNNRKYGYGMTTFKDGSREEGKYKNNILITSNKKKHLFLIRSAKFRERIDSAVSAAQRASKIALQKADIAISRTATARGKAEQADFAAVCAQEDCSEARACVKTLAPEFGRAGLEKDKETTVAAILQNKANLSLNLLDLPGVGKLGPGPPSPHGVKPGPPSPMGFGPGPPSPRGGIAGPTTPIGTMVPGLPAGPSIGAGLSSVLTAVAGPTSGGPRNQGQAQPPVIHQEKPISNHIGNQGNVISKPSVPTPFLDVRNSQQFPPDPTTPIPAAAQPTLPPTTAPVQKTLQLRQPPPARAQPKTMSPPAPLPASEPVKQNLTNKSDMSPRVSTIGLPPLISAPAPRLDPEEPSFPDPAVLRQPNSLQISEQLSRGRTPLRQERAKLGSNNDFIGSQSQSGGGFNFQKIMDDRFEHYKRPPSRERSIDRYGLGSRQGSRQQLSRDPSRDRMNNRPMSRQRTPLNQEMSFSENRAALDSLNLDSPAGALQAVNMDGDGGMASDQLRLPAEDELRFRGVQQEIPHFGAPPKRTESLYMKPVEVQPAPYKMLGGSTLQRKKSLPDVAALPSVSIKQGTQVMTREEISVLSSARREQIRRDLEEAERYRANPILYIFNPHIREWISRQQLMIVVLLVNVTLAIMFFKLLT